VIKSSRWTPLRKCKVEEPNSDKSLIPTQSRIAVHFDSEISISDRSCWN
jgi:hypothetical protein